MTQTVDALVEQIQRLPLHERRSLLKRVLSDFRADAELRGEFAQWAELSNEDWANFEDAL